MSVYTVSKLSQSMKIDGDWNKSQWQNIKVVDIKNRMGDKPIFTPTVKAKMMYDNENLYVIFRVNDRYVRCPDAMFLGHYFNLSNLPPRSWDFTSRWILNISLVVNNQ